MRHLSFTPLAADVEEAVSLIPDSYLEPMYKVGEFELNEALLQNVDGPSQANNFSVKWFGSEKFLANMLQGIRERKPSLLPLDTRFSVLLDKIPDTTTTPPWVKNSKAHSMQVYALVAHDIYKRLKDRYTRLSFSSCEFDTWCQNNLSRGINGFIPEQDFRYLYRLLYQQSVVAFRRRGSFYSLNTTGLIDSVSKKYRQPRNVAFYVQAVNNRNRQLRTTDTPEGWYDSTLRGTLSQEWRVSFDEVSDFPTHYRGS